MGLDGSQTYVCPLPCSGQKPSSGVSLESFHHFQIHPTIALLILFHNLAIARLLCSLKVIENSSTFRDQEVMLIQIPISNTQIMQSSHNLPASSQILDSRAAGLDNSMRNPITRPSSVRYSRNSGPISWPTIYEYACVSAI